MSLNRIIFGSPKTQIQTRLETARSQLFSGTSATARESVVYRGRGSSRAERLKRELISKQQQREADTKRYLELVAQQKRVVEGTASVVESKELKELRAKIEKPEITRTSLLSRISPLSRKERLTEFQRKQLEGEIKKVESKQATLSEMYATLKTEAEALSKQEFLTEAQASAFNKKVKDYELNVKQFEKEAKPVQEKSYSFNARQQLEAEQINRLQPKAQPTAYLAAQEKRGAFGTKTPEERKGKISSAIKEGLNVGKSFEEGRAEAGALIDFLTPQKTRPATGFSKVGEFGREAILRPVVETGAGLLNVPTAFVMKTVGAGVEDVLPAKLDLSLPVRPEIGGLIGGFLLGVKQVPIVRGFVPVTVGQTPFGVPVLSLDRPAAAEALVLAGSIAGPKALKSAGKFLAKKGIGSIPAEVELSGTAKTKGKIGETFETRTRQFGTGKIKTGFGEETFSVSLKKAGIEVKPEIPKQLPRGIEILEPQLRKTGVKGLLEKKTFSESFREPFESKVLSKTIADVVIEPKFKRVIEQQPEPVTKVSLMEEPGRFSINKRGEFTRKLVPSDRAMKLAEAQQEVGLQRSIGSFKLFKETKAKRFNPLISDLKTFGFGETVGLKVTRASAFEFPIEALTKKVKIESFKPSAKVLEARQATGFERGGIVRFYREEALAKGKPKQFGEPTALEGLGEFTQEAIIETKRGKSGEIMLVSRKPIKTSAFLESESPSLGQIKIKTNVLDKFVGIVDDSTIQALKQKKGVLKKNDFGAFNKKFSERTKTGFEGLQIIDKKTGTVSLQKTKALQEKAGKELSSIVAREAAAAKEIGFAAKQEFVPRMAEKAFGQAFGKLDVFGFSPRTGQQEVETTLFKPIQKDIPKARGKVVSFVLPIETPKEREKITDRVIPKELFKQVPKELFKQIPKELTVQVPKMVPKQVLKSIPKEIAKQISKQVPKTIPKQAPLFSIPPFVPVPVILPKLPEFKPPTSFFKEKVAGFLAFVKEEPFKKSKFKKVTSKPVTENEALARGATVTDNTIAQTFKIVKTNKKVQANIFPQPNLQKFRKTKENVFIEKRQSAIDTIGEINKLKVSKYLAMEKRGFARSFSF